ncbi:SDR family NAD(P)-dependent oxidoreductase [Shewanella waksmanii]|uniref:SDR family NAD(P)-dependent oxidoreductase n=1 Tax=Shewanella waksmanii TaxID=213783 RepID=UPI00048D0A6A|nr:SDR family NAD(P)-dependent oxidoreductase [Shewanella waksmanii]
MRFDEQVAIVTGAGGGLGRAYAIALAERGARVALIDNGEADTQSGEPRGTGLKQSHQTLERLGAAASMFLIDVTDEHAVSEVVEQIYATWQRIDILVNNAGHHQSSAFDLLDSALWHQHMDVNVNGSFYFTKAVWPLMKQRSYGRIIMVSASSGLYGNMHETAYGASKMALIGLVNSLSHEGRDMNVHVNTLVPHALTNMTAKHLAPAVKPMFSKTSVNAVMLFLAHNDAPTGQHLLVAAGSVSHGQFTEYDPLYFTSEQCKPEMISQQWPQLYRALPVHFHESGEAQVLAWSKRGASQRKIRIE